MIISLIASIVYWQLAYTFYKASEGFYELDLAEINILQSLRFTRNSTFNLAHWFFAFSYLVISYRMEVTAKRLPADTYNCRIYTLNILFSVLNVAMPAMVWFFIAIKEDKASAIAFAIM